MAAADGHDSSSIVWQESAPGEAAASTSHHNSDTASPAPPPAAALAAAEAAAAALPQADSAEETEQAFRNTLKMEHSESIDAIEVLKRPPLRKRELFAYALPSFSTTSLSLLISLYANDFYGVLSARFSASLCQFYIGFL